MDHELDRVRREAAHLRRRGGAVVELDAVAELLQNGVARLPADLGDVDLLDAVARMREPVGERTVVREQQRAGRVGVEAADRDDARGVADEVDDRRASLRVAHRRDDTGRLVQEYVRERLLRDLASVDLDAVGASDERVQLPGLAVDEDAARLDQLVGAAARRNSGAREVGVEAHG